MDLSSATPAPASCTPSRMLALSGVFMLVTFLVFVAYGVLAAAVRHHVLGRPQVLSWMRRTFAASFVALGARPAFTSR
jgi:threonine/homoserine/homoserine lactone efflux protein